MSPDGDLPKTPQSSLITAILNLLKNTYFKPLMKGEAVERF